ncbi:MAG: 3'-5' exonuclease, partial [Thioalkalivibrio sp.]|nr:3'-5' exonuclease [Thioalkalivibrio sp.]
MNLNKLAFVDLETTGANPVRDRITEIGFIIVEGDSVTRWSSLINPGCRIPPSIQGLTGITQEMVTDAPSFAELADEIQSRLAWFTFIAHNARFDYGFLKNEFKRIG